MNFIDVAGAAMCIVAAGFANVRWLRVAQREHYLAGSVNRFASRWAISTPANLVIRYTSVLALVASFLIAPAGVVVAVAAVCTPIGLSLRGRTSKLAWTRRLKTLAGITFVLQLFIVLMGFAAEKATAGAAVAAYFSPLFVDVAAWIAAPWEKRNAQKFVTSAKKRLHQVAPKVVAITGSYGKTSTKQYAAHLVSSTKSTFASPASFNNRGGLSKAVNEQLSPGTEVFIAEMGAYGFGEIAELCDIFPPDISVMTAIGPVHLERYGSEENIIKAKSEIFTKARVAIINVDDPRIDALADALRSQGKTVWRVGSVTEDADVRVFAVGPKRTVTVKGRTVFSGEMPEAPLTNVACAVAIAVELGVTDAVLAGRLPALPTPHHRQEIAISPEGVTVIDDTFNANPASVNRVIELIGQRGESAKRVIVTPGMVELGRQQHEDNKKFAKDAAAVVTDLVVVGRTNRAALVEGAREGGVTPVVVERLPEAVAWVRQNVGRGDAVAYVNDLPDHFP